MCIDQSKQYLVVARLMPIVKQRKIPSLETLIDRVRQGVDPTLEKDVLCAMMTHETSFFRDRAPFEALRTVMLYFDVPTRAAVVGRVRRVLRPDGSLFLGGAETMIGIDDGWTRITLGGCSHYAPRPRR